MTLAICHSCGEKKSGCLVACSKCNNTPTSRDDLAASLLLSDHYYDVDVLKDYSQRIKNGSKITVPRYFVDEVSAGLDGRPWLPHPDLLEHSNSRPIVSFLWCAVTQRGRNDEAQKIMAGLRSGLNKSTFSLYLRPFQFDSSVFYRRCERLLTLLVSRHMPLVCLEVEPQRVGAARVRTDDANWESDFKLLARSATVIFAQEPMGPQPEDRYKMDLSQGLRFEFEALARERLTGRIALIQSGSLWDFGEEGPRRGYVFTTHRDFAQFWSSVTHLRRLNSASIREILDKSAQYVDFHPPVDRAIHELVSSYYTAQLREFLTEYQKQLH